MRARSPNPTSRRPATALGDVTVSRETVVADAAVIVFREGLEAVLILAAITASFTGVRRCLPAAGADRRPARSAGDRGHLRAGADDHRRARRRRSAAAGDHRACWRSRCCWSSPTGSSTRSTGASGSVASTAGARVLEKVDRFGFISGQMLGFVLLGVTSVYREGFETVLFLQNLQVSAGTASGDPRRRLRSGRDRDRRRRPRSRSSASCRTRRC